MISIVKSRTALRVMWGLAAAIIIASLFVNFRNIYFIMAGIAFGSLTERLKE
jgi:hypothetical protein